MSMSASVPSTPASEIASKHAVQKAFFDSSATRSLPFRRTYLHALVALLRENLSALTAALSADLGKSAFESQITEVEVVIAEALDAAHNLRSWNASESVSSPGVLFPSTCEIKVDPRGVVLIVGPFNYPISLILGPLVSALAGGNCAVLKPSELCPHVSNVIARLVPLYFPPALVTVVEGAIPETTVLTSLPWGLIFFTGSGRVGSIIAEAAAKTLTPCVLELGGKSPVIIARDHPHVETMCNRILWGKTINAGQTCVAPDYVLCHSSVLSEFLDGLKAASARMFNGNEKSGGVFSRNVSEAHTRRLASLVEDALSAGGKLILGGTESADVAARFLAPTVVLAPPKTCRIMTEEIFGVLLPIISYDDEAEAVSFVRSLAGPPLALYVFTTSSETYERLSTLLPSGGSCRNDVVLHFAVGTLPFGGIGGSGYGAGHGIAGFKTFTHRRGSLERHCGPASEFMGIRYPPYNKFGGKSGIVFLFLMRRLPFVPPIDRRVALKFASLAVGVTVLAKIVAGDDDSSFRVGLRVGFLVSFWFVVASIASDRFCDWLEERTGIALSSVSRGSNTDLAVNKRRDDDFV